MFDPVTAGIAAVATIGGALIASNAASSAADAQVEASQNASDTQLQMYEQGRDDTAPWREAGKNALATLVKKTEAGPGWYMTSPEYQFRLNEGTKALERAASAKGNVLSPATSKALARYAEDYVSNDYQNWLANYYQSLTPYQSIAGVGQTAATNTANQATQVGANIGANQIASGTAEATGTINQANAVTGAMNSGINNYMLWKYMNNPSAPATTSSIPTNYAIG